MDISCVFRYSFPVIKSELDSVVINRTWIEKNVWVIARYASIGGIVSSVSGFSHEDLIYPFHVPWRFGVEIICGYNRGNFQIHLLNMHIRIKLIPDNVGYSLNHWIETDSPDKISKPVQIITNTIVAY